MAVPFGLVWGINDARAGTMGLLASTYRRLCDICVDSHTKTLALFNGVFLWQRLLCDRRILGLCQYSSIRRHISTFSGGVHITVCAYAGICFCTAIFRVQKNSRL